MPPGRQRHRHRGRAHEREHARRIGTTLRVHVSFKQDCDHETDRGENEHEGSGRPRPVGGHSVARQVAWHNIEQTGHRRGTGKPEDTDRTEIIDRAKDLTEHAMRQIS